MNKILLFVIILLSINNLLISQEYEVYYEYEDTYSTPQNEYANNNVTVIDLTEPAYEESLPETTLTNLINITNTVISTNIVDVTNTEIIFVTNTNTITLPNIVPISINACTAVLTENLSDLESFYNQNNNIISKIREDGNSLLHLAVTKKNPTIIEFLINKGSDINLTNKYGQTPLHISALMNNPIAGKLLLQAEADLSLKDNFGRTALGIANIKNFPLMLQMLAKKKASQKNSPETIEKKVEEIPLQTISSVPSNFDLYKNFSKKISEEGPILDNIWHRALFQPGYLETQKILRMGISPYDKDKYGQNAFHIAALYNNLDALKYLLLYYPLKMKEYRDNFGATPLHIAAGRSSPALVAELMNNGCRITSKNKGGWTPFFDAIFLSNDDNVLFFVTNGISPNIRTPQGRTPLHEASAQGNTEIVQKLLDAGALFNVSDYQGNTPFYLAAQQGHIGVLGVLLDKGADPNIINKDSMNALHIAILNNQIDTVNFLINIANINLLQPDEAGRTPLDIAYIYGNTEIINMLALKYAEN